ncbi:SDR family NAD(P)-dependent oxidoreductase [Chitinophaga sp. Cy-1792]|uniref:SDR family NAD(P)-dependent oxidoreductase n=1 Tax=Chitinophaga sp. Cy-1792 TaxID=2608339 RepID=UPI00141EE6A9|nr:SDR family oxidoreductase [Chitinophaga sp. Cy-1792]NIG55891.1 SDR family oxidoreductase [Chitinophaga sp. Cy-1792]
MERDFTPQEWDTCIKVLQALSRDPDQSMDTLVLKGLVTKLYKRAQREKKLATAESIINNIVIPDSLSLQKLRNISLKQDQLKQYDKKVNFLQTGMVRKYQQPATDTMDTKAELPALLTFHKCYTCKADYKEMHFFYHMLCPACATLNYAKRTQRCDLTGRVAVVTGGRIKIGYLTALQLLRDGARVWVTTRFARDCASRFHQEPDFSEWSHRLKIVSLDLRNLHQVKTFIEQLYSSEQYLDIIIHNAAQTVKRPAAFYQHLFELEEAPLAALPAAVQSCVMSAGPFHFPADSGEMQLLPAEINKYFPEGRYDKDRQQIDLRTSNSWTLRLDEITPVEMLETQLVNVTAPFMMNSRLKTLMQQSPFERKFIINVSAMEGQFNRGNKTCYHAHTNMAKAALNMMTRTAAQDYAQDGIYMNSVDTGWITQENPHPIKEWLYEEQGFVPPLDETDGMARIYDPVVSGLTKPEIPLFGHFLKDYFPYAW